LIVAFMKSFFENVCGITGSSVVIFFLVIY